jgi:hypothetical protein
MDRYISQDGLIMEPDFQRGHVWTAAQQVAYMEYFLRGGTSGRDLYTNCPGWYRGDIKDFVVVDGKQRLTAALRFLHNEIGVFGGHLYKEFTDIPRMHLTFIFHVNTLQTRAEVLQWYIEMNVGGTPHTTDEIDRVKELLRAELESSDTKHAK